MLGWSGGEGGKPGGVPLEEGVLAGAGVAGGGLVEGVADDGADLLVRVELLIRREVACGAEHQGR